MHNSRADLGVAVVDGKIYTLGGNSIGTSEPYNPGTNEEYNLTTAWWTLKVPMPVPESRFGIAVYQNKIYCTGGAYGTNQVYDPHQIPGKLTHRGQHQDGDLKQI